MRKYLSRTRAFGLATSLFIGASLIAAPGIASAAVVPSATSSVTPAGVVVLNTGSVEISRVRVVTRYYSGSPVPCPAVPGWTTSERNTYVVHFSYGSPDRDHREAYVRQDCIYASGIAGPLQPGQSLTVPILGPPHAVWVSSPLLGRGIQTS